jgi:hypothetical protein
LGAIGIWITTSPHANGAPIAATHPEEPMMREPRVIIAMPDQWPRALLRAALLEIGYDAIGTRTLAGVSRYLAPVPDRGDVGAVVVDVAAVGAADADALADLCARRAGVPVLLLDSALTATPAGCWTQIMRRPFSIDDVVRAVAALVPRQ